MEKGGFLLWTSLWAFLVELYCCGCNGEGCWLMEIGANTGSHGRVGGWSSLMTTGA